MMPKQTMFQSIQGPTDSALRSNAVEGYTQVSRVGEQVLNAFGTRHPSTCTPHRHDYSIFGQ